MWFSSQIDALNKIKMKLVKIANHNQNIQNLNKKLFKDKKRQKNRPNKFQNAKFGKF